MWPRCCTRTHQHVRSKLLKACCWCTRMPLDRLPASVLASPACGCGGAPWRYASSRASTGCLSRQPAAPPLRSPAGPPARAAASLQPRAAPQLQHRRCAATRRSFCRCLRLPVGPLLAATHTSARARRPCGDRLMRTGYARTRGCPLALGLRPWSD